MFGVARRVAQYRVYWAWFARGLVWVLRRAILASALCACAVCPRARAEWTSADSLNLERIEIYTRETQDDVEKIEGYINSMRTKVDSAVGNLSDINLEFGYYSSFSLDELRTIRNFVDMSYWEDWQYHGSVLGALGDIQDSAGAVAVRLDQMHYRDELYYESFLDALDTIARGANRIGDISEGLEYDYGDGDTSEEDPELVPLEAKLDLGESKPYEDGQELVGVGESQLEGAVNSFLTENNEYLRAGTLNTISQFPIEARLNNLYQYLDRAPTTLELFGRQNVMGWTIPALVLDASWIYNSVIVQRIRGLISIVMVGLCLLGVWRRVAAEI